MPRLSDTAFVGAAILSGAALAVMSWPAAAQTTLTMSSWVSPTPSADQGRAGGLGTAGREGHQRPRQAADAAQASLGRARHLRRGQGRPGRCLLRHRELHARPARPAAACAELPGRRRHRRDQLGGLLAHPLEVSSSRSASTRASSCSACSRTGRARCSTPSGRSPRSRTWPA